MDEKLSALDADLLRVLSLRRPDCIYEECFCERMTNEGLMERRGFLDDPAYEVTAEGRAALARHRGETP
jgi:hypothetical protein